MRKTIIASNGYALADQSQPGSGAWLDLAAIGRVEMSSEDAAFPVEGAFSLHQSGHTARGWRASIPGAQTLHLHFDHPQTVHRILLHFHDAECERSQEFSLHATLASGHRKELVRQQWSFSPGGSIDEQENYVVALDDVSCLTLWIDPDRGRNRYPATLESFRIEA